MNRTVMLLAGLLAAVPVRSAAAAIPEPGTALRQAEAAGEIQDAERRMAQAQREAERIERDRQRAREQAEREQQRAREQAEREQQRARTGGGRVGVEEVERTTRTVRVGTNGELQIGNISGDIVISRGSSNNEAMIEIVKRGRGRTSE